MANEEPKIATPINAMPSLSVSDTEPAGTVTPTEDQATPPAKQSSSSEQPVAKKEVPRKTAKRALFTETEDPSKPSSTKKSKNQDWSQVICSYRVQGRIENDLCIIA